MFMDSKPMTEQRATHRRRPLAMAAAAGLLLSTGLMVGCDNDPAQTAAKSPLGQQAASSYDRAATIKGGEVIARINGSPLYRENLEVIKENLGAGVTDQHLVSRMIELRLLADQARKEGLQNEPAIQARLQNVIDNQLANSYLTRYLAELEISDSELEAAYDKAVEALGDQEQHHARHILVQDEELARDLLKELEGGADFAKLAEEHSIDTGSARAGGDLGWFSLDQMVEPFSAAVAELEPGKLADEPVETQFGWHIIKLEGVRKSPPPSFEQMRPELADNIRRQAITDQINALRAEANVEILTQDVRPMDEQDQNGAADGTATEVEQTDTATNERPGKGMDGLPTEPLKARP